MVVGLEVAAVVPEQAGRETMADQPMLLLAVAAVEPRQSVLVREQAALE